jgi:hypothetical protein
MLSQGANQPLARLGRIHQRIEECRAIAIGQHKRFMLGDRPTCRVGDFVP